MNYFFLNSARKWGGNEKWIHLATKALARDNTVYLAYRRDVVGARFKIFKFKLPFINELDIYTLFRILIISKRKSIDVIISTKPKDYLLGGVAARLCDIKNIVRLGIVRNIGESFYKKLLYNTLATGIIVNSPAIKETLLRSPFMAEEKVHVIFNGVDCDELDAQAALAPAADIPFRFLVTSVGELSERKGVEFLLRGFARFTETISAADAGLLIIGDGDKRKQLMEEAEELGISAQVLFTGFLENPYPCVARSDVFVLASKNEGISNALLEAMYLQNAVITTRTGGITAVVHDGENGLLVSYGDTAHLSECLTTLYRDAGFRENLGRSARRFVKRRFSLIRMKTEIENLCA